jgi:hypothetical protein
MKPAPAPIHGTARMVAAILLAVVVLLAAVGAGIAIGRSHHASSPTTTTTTAVHHRKVKRCTKRKVKLGLCSLTSTTSAPGPGTSLSGHEGTSEPLASTELHSQTSIARVASTPAV